MVRRVHASTDDLTEPGACAALVHSCGEIDILVANLMEPNRRHAITDTGDDEWHAAFDAMVHPLHRLVRAVLPQMIARRSGKIVVMGSANGMRGTTPRAAYSAARGAQLSYVRSVGIEVAGHGINVNAIAQNYISNPTSYPAEKVQSPAFAATLAQIPAGRIGAGWGKCGTCCFSCRARQRLSARTGFSTDRRLDMTARTAPEQMTGGSACRQARAGNPGR